MEDIKGPCYSLTVSSDNLDCHANLGWDLKMIEYLDALRKALDKGSDAGKAMDKVINALAPQRKKWQTRAPRATSQQSRLRTTPLSGASRRSTNRDEADVPSAANRGRETW